MIDISVSDKQMKPQVIHTDQFENGVHVLRFTIADYMQNDVDLRNFDSYVVTSIKGVPDITQVPSTVSGRSLILTWSLSSHTLKEPGIIQYQLVLSKSSEDGNVVWSSYKGVIINRVTIDADDYISANYPTLMKQWLDLMHTLSGEFGAPITYMLPGESIPVGERLANRMYYQWVDTPNTAATCATGIVNLGKRPYVDSGLYINNTHICVDTINTEAYAVDPAIWVDSINNANCGVIATDISSGEDVILLISAKTAGETGNDITLKLDVAMYGAGKGVSNPSGGHVSGSTLTGGSESTVGVSSPRGYFEDYQGNALGYDDSTQNQLNTKQDKNVGTANRVLITDPSGNIVASSTIDTTQLGHLDGAISNIQNQLNAKAASSHTHGISDVNDLQTQLNGKAASSHSHAISDITNLQTTLNGKAASTHSHAISDVTNLQTSLDNKQNKNLGSSNANMVLVTDANGKIAASSTISTSELSALNGFIISGGTAQAQLTALQNKINELTSQINAIVSKQLSFIPIPDYSNGVDISSYLQPGSSWTATANGVIRFHCDKEQQFTIYSNGEQIFYLDGCDTTHISSYLTVEAGQTLTSNKGNEGIGTATFFPFKTWT